MFKTPTADAPLSAKAKKPPPLLKVAVPARKFMVALEALPTVTLVPQVRVLPVPGLISTVPECTVSKPVPVIFAPLIKVRVLGPQTSKPLAARVRGVEFVIGPETGLIWMPAVAVMPLRPRVKGLPLSFSILLFKLMALPVSEKAEAPESKYQIPKALLAVKLLTGEVRMLPAKSNCVAVPTVGAVPPQLAGVVMLLSVPPPFHKLAAEADRAAPSNRVAQIGSKDFLDEGFILVIVGCGLGANRENSVGFRSEERR